MKIIASIAVLLPATAWATLLPPPNGPYQVTWESQELVDNSRVDPFNTSHSRRLMVSRFSPVSPSLCKRKCRVPYLPPSIASFEDISLRSQLAELPDIPDAKWPFGILAKLELEFCCDVRHEVSERRRFPTLLFGTGLNTTRLFYSAVAQQLASLGYEIIVMDYPYETDIVQFPSGEIIYGIRSGSDVNDDKFKALALDVRTQDASFVLNTFKVCKTVYIGHSFGGSTAAHAMLSEVRIAGGVNLDGLFEMPAVQLGVPRAFLDLRHDNTSRYSSYDPSFPEFFTSMNDKHPDVWTKALSMKDTTHNSYTDFSIIGDVTGLRNDSALFVVFGTAPGERVMKVFRAYLGNFVRFTLGNGDEGLLSRPSNRFPDVSFLRSWRGW